ncbi:MAG: hypothetical protein ACRERC_14140 [Candidatus Binatia bacterium]
MNTPSPLPHGTRLRPRQRAAAVYRQRAARSPLYGAPGAAAPASVDSAAPTAARVLQRRYPLISALLAELDLMGDESRLPLRRPQRS